MASGYTEIVLAFISLFLFICRWNWNGSNSFITNWPVFEMLLGLFRTENDIQDIFFQRLRESGWTLVFKGPWLSNINCVITSDPLNVHHICSKNFANYPKGPEFKMIMEPMGDGIFNTDGDLWESQRKSIHSLLKHSKFESSLVNAIHREVEKGLIPVLEHASEKGIMVDLQEVFQRFTFDNICQLVLGLDPNCLCIEFPKFEYEQAYNELEEIVIHRYLVPQSYWKLQKWLQIGKEKRFSRAWKIFDKFLYESISTKRERLSRRKSHMKEDEFDLLTAFIKEEEVKQDGQIGASRVTDKFLRDIAFNLLGAGRDTVSAGLAWFFWLVATHPSIEARILEEIKSNMHTGKHEGAKQLDKMVYLHAALCETLRLYPPVPINHKTAAEADILPSGHRVNPNERILLSYYSMARMEEIWGKDCLEFKPERWISKGGCIVHIPSYIFTAFHAGPRNCLGKKQAFIQMKMVAIAIIKNYHIRVVEGHRVSPSKSMILSMEDGLKVWVSRRHV